LAENVKDHFRVSFIAGGLGTGGAEKQFIYMLRALMNQGAGVQVLTLTEGETHENSLEQLGVQAVRIGPGKPPGRIIRIDKAVRSFKPHFIQSTHFFSSLYAGIAGRLAGTPSIGAVRGDLLHDISGVGAVGRLLVRLPTVLLANSNNARRNAVKMGLSAERVYVLQNVIDLDDFYKKMEAAPSLQLPQGRVRVATVARLTPVKRLERFLKALEQARQTSPMLEGIIIGDGPEGAKLRSEASALGLRPNQPDGGVHFLGERRDIPQLLSQVDIFMLTSDREGFPNVFLEAMAAGLPIIATPAGETPDLVTDEKNGFLVPFENAALLVNRLEQLAQSPILRRTMGQAGRTMVEECFSFPRLEKDLLQIYKKIAEQQQNRAAINALKNGDF
jgi:glycosyltransferase involved in cell wall biosynthesis